ncbi:methylenetetrahydrofolate reductase [NAD(P)H] [Periweissella fabalis]|uniref:Methylenetetrahydrofolate reductase n=1 Tax=Periweissella fabalis TaxID=1070421 RepID=A0A7X6N220_9LACO|nr:methylenetetrahydrofolate reductase [NAD(P)H] [Periweissella fabalis]MCM0598982.1 methylenetetrahydrofolate reductase [NAD(P)H] [Periweissella fabalis]NKZ23262.1 methylenetetrahydrofolate reductase [NAD(P)H] [Periweissella fabalis]
MGLTELFDKKLVFSLEVFPPHTAVGIEHLQKTLVDLEQIKPDFISVTLGASGITKSEDTIKVADFIQNDLKIPAVAHVPGLYQSKDEVRRLLDALVAHDVKNVLVLRGDAIKDQIPIGEFKHADDLAAFIKEYGTFDIAGACYPQVHLESTSTVSDIRYLKRKVAAGVSHLITQVFFDNKHFYNFKERLELADIDVPVEAGIMPCTNKKQMERIAQITGIKLPKKFVSILSRYENKPLAMRDAGIAFAVDQIVDLISSGVDGIHLYTMNNADNAKLIWQATHTLFEDATEMKTMS